MCSQGPHDFVEWVSARDQKLYSDIVAGSCCGKPRYHLLFPSRFKVGARGRRARARTVAARATHTARAAAAHPLALRAHHVIAWQWDAVDACCSAGALAPLSRCVLPLSGRTLIWQVVDQYAFMRQWGQNAKCSTMNPQEANGLQTWWHALLQVSRQETALFACGRGAVGRRQGRGRGAAGARQGRGGELCWGWRGGWARGRA